MVNNPNFFSTSSSASPLNQIKDAIDFPHSGLIKSLNGVMSDRFLISGCNITVGSSPHTAFTVTTGVAIIEGKKQAISGATINLTNTQTNGFHLIVAPKPSNNTSTVVFRESTGNATNTIPDITAGDTIIAVVKYLGSGTAPEIQYLTADKKSSSLSIAREDGNNAYEQTLSIVGEAANTQITSEKNSVTLKLNGDTSSSLFQITDDANQLQFAVKGDGTLTTDVTASRALVTDANKNITASAVTSTELGLLSGAAFGIGNGNILRANANLADDDFLRVDGTQIEGRTAAQTLSDIAAMPLAGGTFTGAVTVDTGQTFRTPRLPIVGVSSPTTLTEATHAGAYLFCVANVTLPATSNPGEHYTILNISTGNITVARNGNNINDAASDITVATHNGVTCIAIGQNSWIALGV
jgi:nucleoside 2-deoxyribosyltransferase